MDQKKQSQLQKEKQVLLSKDMEEILNCSSDGIWITDGDGYVLYVNRANEKMLGVPREQMLGKTCAELVKQKVFQSSATMESIKTKKSVTMMGYNYKTNMHVLITSSPLLSESGNIRYVINNVRDMTQLKTTMTQLRRKEQVISEQQEEIHSLLSLKNQQDGDRSIIAVSPKMKKILDMARRAGQFDSTVLILGESGTGKEVIADEIVRNSSRSGKAYVKVNCGAIPENLIESELFGYEPGAFTGASKKGKMGLFELANEGTILLDEIGELPQHLQVKLLRVLQERKIQRVGGTKEILLDLRVLAATNADLKGMVDEGKFRSDLYYRLNVVSISIPPVRERREDIPQLLLHYKNEYTGKYGIQKEFSEKAIQCLCRYDWPGNIRELQNVVENLVIMTEGVRIEAESLPEQIQQRVEEHVSSFLPGDEIRPLREAVEDMEELMIRRALEKYGSTREAARALGVNQSTIVRKLQSFNNKRNPEE